MITIFIIFTSTINNNIKQDSLINKEKTEDKWFGFDKIHHFFYSAAISGLSFHLLHCKYNLSSEQTIPISISSTLILGVAKECYDLKNKHHFSYKDLTFDILGIITGYIIFMRGYD